MRAVILALLALLSCVSNPTLARDVRNVEGGGVAQLTRDDFNALLNSWESALVMFYAKWCSESQKLMPKVEEAAKNLHASGSSVRLAAVEATKFPEIRHQHRVAAFPTILVFINGQPIGRYTGELTPQAIHEFFEKLRSTLKAGSLPKLASDEHSMNAGTPDSTPAHLHGHMMQLTADTFDKEIARHQYAMVNFGATWCKWTRALLPEFAKAGEALKQAHPGVLLASVDCEQEPRLEHAYHIHAFPTMLLFKCGKLVGRYTGDRTSEALTDFVSTWVKTDTERGGPAPWCSRAAVSPNAVLSVAASAAGEKEGGNVVLGMVVAGCLVGTLLLVTLLSVCYACRNPVEEQPEPIYWWHYVTGVRVLPGTEIEESQKPDKLKASMYQPVFVHAVDVDVDVDVDPKDEGEREDGKLLG